MRKIEIDPDEEKRVIHMFKTERENGTVTIAKKLMITESRVNRHINTYLSNLKNFRHDE
jgi:DNA-directed RNA polymerase specialized sigma subunit